MSSLVTAGSDHILWELTHGTDGSGGRRRGVLSKDKVLPQHSGGVLKHAKYYDMKIRHDYDISPLPFHVTVRHTRLQG